MANKYIKLFPDIPVLSKYGKSFHRLVEYASTPGLVYTKNQDDIGYPYYYSCDGIGEAVADNVVVADTVEGTLVTKIGDHAFSGLQTLTSVVLPNSITHIGAGAFSLCSKLSKITLPTEITTIEAMTFQACGGLNHIEIPDGVTKIDSQAFEGCRYLMYIKIPASVTYIGANALANCNVALGIYFEGTEEQWNNITKEPTWNAPLYNYTIKYEYTGALPVLPTSEVIE